VANEYCVVITTTETKEDAKAIAKSLLEAKLAACVQLSPIDSLYTWKGEMAEESEVLLLIKTREDLFSRVEESIKSNHKYETPEIIQVPIEAGSKEYLSWINEVT
jgi:periplasmic divalent cation tolerance protein